MALPAPSPGPYTAPIGVATPEGKAFGISALRNMMYADMANQASLAAQRFIAEWEQRRARKKAKEKEKKKKGGALGGAIGGTIAGLAAAPFTGGMSIPAAMAVGAGAAGVGTAAGQALGGGSEGMNFGGIGLGALGGGLGAGLGASMQFPVSMAATMPRWALQGIQALPAGLGAGLGAMGISPQPMMDTAAQARYMQNLTDPNFDPYDQNMQLFLRMMGMGPNQPGVPGATGRTGRFTTPGQGMPYGGPYL